VDNSNEESETPCVRSTTNNIIGANNTQTLASIEGLSFPFSDGSIFHGTLDEDTVVIRFDMTTDSILTISISSNAKTARGKINLEPCQLFQEAPCLFNVRITDSEFSIGRGPQSGETLALQNWTFFTLLDNCTNRITATLTVENLFETRVTSEAAIVNLPTVPLSLIEINHADKTVAQ
tara:strand:+ start:9799 stop:10332 length:534 start_codon:yes stop_codon:yes gene_type:complete